jgi:hypothetical protein
MNNEGAMQIATTQSLDGIAARINEENAQLEGDQTTMVERAARIGGWLLEAKALLPHGEFMKWRAEKISVERSQAQKYMALAANYHSGGILPGSGVNAAYVAIRAPKRTPGAQPARRAATGPRTKAAAKRLQAINAASQQTYTAGALRACIRAIRESPDDAAAEIELVEELMAELAAVARQVHAGLSEAA